MLGCRSGGAPSCTPWPGSTHPQHPVHPSTQFAPSQLPVHPTTQFAPPAHHPVPPSSQFAPPHHPVPPTTQFAPPPVGDTGLGQGWCWGRGRWWRSGVGMGLGVQGGTPGAGIWDTGHRMGAVMGTQGRDRARGTGWARGVGTRDGDMGLGHGMGTQGGDRTGDTGWGPRVGTGTGLDHGLSQSPPRLL